jgi:hypothetical protein
VKSKEMEYHEVSRARMSHDSGEEKGGVVMKRMWSSLGLVGLVALLAIVLAVPPPVGAKEGSFLIKTEDGDTFSFGAQLRMIPTSENDWDFGLGTVTIFGSEEVNAKRHVNESGEVAQGYIRTEARLYFTGEDKDKKWSLYSALEFDSVVDQTEVDQRGRDYGPVWSRFASTPAGTSTIWTRWMQGQDSFTATTIRGSGSPGTSAPLNSRWAITRS